MSSPATIRVIGIGSVLMSDDGLGPALVERLRNGWQFPSTVELVDAGTPGPELLYLLQDVGAVLIVDAVRGAGPPGTMRRYRRDELLEGAPEARLSPHDPGLRKTLLTLELVGGLPSRLELLGLVPGRVELGTQPSSVVEEAMPALEAASLEVLRGWGVVPRARPGAPRPAWWQRGRRAWSEDPSADGDPGTKKVPG